MSNSIIDEALTKQTLEEAVAVVMEWEIHRAVKQALNNSDSSKERIQTHYDGALYDTCSNALTKMLFDKWIEKHNYSTIRLTQSVKY